MSELGHGRRLIRAVHRDGIRFPAEVLRYLINHYSRIRVGDFDPLPAAFHHLWAGQSQSFNRLTSKFLTLSGVDLKRSDFFSALLDVVQRRATLDLHHDKALDEMQGVIDSNALAGQEANSLLAASTLVCAVGLFEQGLAIEQAALKNLRNDAEIGRTRHSRYLGALSALHRGDLDHFASLMLSPEMNWIYSGGSHRTASLATYARLLGIQGNAQRQEHFPENPLDRAWCRYVNDSNVLLYGPSDSIGLEDQDFTSFKVIRSLAPGVLQWATADDLVSGRADVAYLNEETLIWFQSLPSDRQEEALQRWDFLISKGYDERVSLPFSRLMFRGARKYSGLFISGHANMFPIMLLDILPRIPKRTVVAGMNFYLAQTPYRLAHRRLNPNGGQVNFLGSDGAPFKMCLPLARHNLFQNRNVVRNLYRVHAIEGDVGFKSVMNMTNETYAKGLADLFGRASA